MESIKRFSKKKVYDVAFIDIEGNICGKANGVSNIANIYGLNDLADVVCTKMPKYAVVVNTDGTEWGKWILYLNFSRRE